MEETLKEVISDTTETANKSVILFIQSRFTVLNGYWSWDMRSSAVYCSDVMHFPNDFEGTKGIIHPDDVSKVRSALELLQDRTSLSVDFRLITTYGEVKKISGQRITIDNSLAETMDGTAEEWNDALQELVTRKENEFLQLRKELAEATEKLNNIGSWFVNKDTGLAWYSDNVFRIHGLPAQSLNAHANTFNSFIYSEDRAAVLEAFENAYLEEVPLHIEYRIVHANGNIRYVQQLTQWSFDKNGHQIFSGIIRDVTEERETAEHLLTTETKARLHQQVLNYSEQQVAAGYWFINLITRKASYSDNYYRIYGVKPALSHNNNTFLGLVHPDDKQKMQAAMEKMYKEHSLPEMEFRIIRADGKQRHLRQLGKVLIQGDSELVMVGVLQDITVLKGIEKKIQQLNENVELQNLTIQAAEEIAGLCSVIWLDDGLMQWSDGFYKLLGYKPRAIEPMQGLIHRIVHPQDLKTYKDAELLVLNSQAHDDVRFRIISKAGIRFLNLSFRRIWYQNKEVVLGLVQDITAQAGVQQKHSEAMAFSQLLANSIDQIVLLTDTDYNVVSWNDTAAKKTGIKKEGALNSNLFDLFPELNEEKYLQRLQAVMSGEEINVSNTRYGYLKTPHNYCLVPFRNEEGQVNGVLHVVKDISLELELQQQLNDRLNFIENLVESSVDRIVVLDKHMNYLYWNRKAEEYYSINKERILGKNILEVFPGFRNDPSYQEFRKVLKGDTVHIPAAVDEESFDYFETYLIPIKNDSGEITAVLWVVHDLTNEYQLQQHQLRAQQQLAEEHRRFKEAQAIGRVGSFEWNAATDTIYWSDEMYRIHGIDSGETITLEKIFSLAHPDDRQELMEKTMSCRRKASMLNITHRLIRPDGEMRIVTRDLQSFTDENGNVTHLSGTVQDVTEQKLAEQQLKAQAHYLQRIQETVPDMISVTDLRTKKFDYLNKDTFIAHGFDPDEMASKSREELTETIHVEDRQALAEYFQKFTTASDADIITAEYRAKDHNNLWKWFLVRGRAFQRSETGMVTHVLNVIENITERKKAEEEILRLKDEVAQKVTDKYLTLFNSIDEAVVWCEMIKDENGKPVDYRLLELNPAFEKMTGLTVEYAKGKTAKELVPTITDWWIETYAKVAFEGEVIRFENKVDELGRWFNAYASPVGDKKDGQFVLVYSDITERKKADNEKEETPAEKK